MKIYHDEFKLSFLKLGWRPPKNKNKKIKNWKNFFKKNSSGVSQVGLKNTQRSKELSEKVQVKFLNYCPLYIYIYVYRDDKLEEDWKCKVRRKTNWKMIQSVKQEGKQNGIWKKWERNIFFEKKYI